MTNIITYDQLIQNKNTFLDKILSIDLQNKCEVINYNLLSGCYNITTIFNTKNLKIIEQQAFDEFDKLSNIYLDNAIETIESNAFDETSIKIINIPNSIKSIEQETFILCKKLEKIIFNKNSKLECIKKRAFYNCVSLKYIKFPKSLKFIESKAFKNCESLICVLIPKTVDHIESNAFENCINLKYIKFY